MWFDPILQRFARTFPNVDLRYRTRLESFEASDDGVTADIVDLPSGRRERVEAEYLVGCDGANSMVRRALGIGLAGHGVLGHSLNLFFRAPDLLKKCGKEPGTSFIAVDRGGLWAILRVIDPANAMWRLMVLDVDGKQTPETIDRKALIRRVDRPAHGCRMAGPEHLDPAQHGGRTLFARQGVSCRRRGPSILADRRAGHEHRHW